jgi:trehalose 6-phosphate phosphatase
MKMRILTLSDERCKPFWKNLYSAGSPALISDYDGTLAPFRTERTKAVPYRGVPELIDRILTKTAIRFVVVSGRPALEVGRLLGTRNSPEIWGAHGWERMLPDGTFRQWPVSKKALSGLSKARQAVEANSLQQHCEIKTGALALHWRGVSQERREKINNLIDLELRPIATRYNLTLRPFDGGIELLAGGRNKGDAINKIIGEGSADIYPIYLGDDLTDEDAFEAVARAGGQGILVSKKHNSSKAHFQLIPPDGVIDFFRFCLTMKEG